MGDKKSIHLVSTSNKVNAYGYLYYLKTNIFAGILSPEPSYGPFFGLKNTKSRSKTYLNGILNIFLYDIGNKLCLSAH